MQAAWAVIGTVIGALGGDPLERRELTTGVRLAVLPVKEATIETFFAFVPTGLGHDPRGRTQWSHLLEHMAIRSTDPAELVDGDIRFNGETGDGSLRFDVHAPPAQAPLAAAKLCAWLGAFEFDPDVLEREKQKIAGELAATVPQGYGHKWATAAWTQVVRHGATDVAVLGDVMAATVEQVAEQADVVLKLGSGIAIYAVGPLPADEVVRLFDSALASGGGLDALANALGGNPRAGKPAAQAHAAAPAAAPAAAAAAAADLLGRGERSATWDLGRAHVIEWYLLPDATAVDRLAAATLANVLSMTLMQDRVLREAGIVALASADVALPAGRVLLLSASLPEKVAPGAAAATARVAFRSAIDACGTARPFASLDELVVMTRNELAGGLPDLKLLRKQAAGRPNGDLVEAQLLLGLAHREWSTRLTLPQLAQASQQLAAPALRTLIDAKLAPTAANVVLLTPRK